MVKTLPASAEDERDVGSVPWLGRSPRGGNVNSLQYSCLGNPMDRRAWWATVHGVAKSWTRRSTTQQPIHISVDKEENTMESIHKSLKLLVFTHNLTLSKFLSYLFFL